jgi:hypothetical protein
VPAGLTLLLAGLLAGLGWRLRRSRPAMRRPGSDT